MIWGHSLVWDGKYQMWIDVVSTAKWVAPMLGGQPCRKETDPNNVLMLIPTIGDRSRPCTGIGSVEKKNGSLNIHLLASGFGGDVWTEYGLSLWTEPVEPTKRRRIWSIWNLPQVPPPACWLRPGYLNWGLWQGFGVFNIILCEGIGSVTIL